ncbi:S49 family peptidase [Rhizobium sp. S152]|uniref:S49 family peptidase n=1 Tax=Rhizobium sp. S152 TaxID=3055038 RepID=UPI0025A995ED|nr:S49 family peptidase [Rhizobium sp. S152]MDM9626295.1 S49 family peptidase [Rhizobium sp. S152]
MTTPNVLLASFDNEPALVNPGMRQQFEAFAHTAQTILARIEGSRDVVVMQDDFWPSAHSWLAIYRPYIVKNGILMIPVKGVLIHGMGYAIGNYATGYVYIMKALERGLADPDVKGIAFICDSPGGHVAGNFDLVDKIYNARGRKPMRGYASENAYSACYSIISAVDPGQVHVTRTGGVGSIGVVTMHLDVSQAVGREGLKVTFIHFGKHKVDGNAYEALPAEVKKRIQARIDGLGEIFVSTVARNRGMDAQAVRDTEALTFTAEEAVSNGLADTIGSLDDVIAVFAADMSKRKDTNMTAAVRSTTNLATRNQAPINAIRPQEVAAERKRIAGIMALPEAMTRPSAAMAAAVDSDMTVDQASAFLARLPEERQAKSSIQQAMDDVYGPRSEAAESRSKLLAGDPNTLSRAERAMREAGYEPR